MPWDLVHNHPACRAGEWAVVNRQAEEEGRHSIEGCHPTKEKALAQQRALYANEPKDHEVHTMERKSFTAPAEWKAVNGDPGTLDGYLSVFDTVDLGGDVVVRGAFQKTLERWSRRRQRIPLLIDHKMSTDGVVGSIAEAREDQVGLKVRAQFSSIAKAQDIRTLMLEGHLNGMSFTYEALKSRPGVKDGKRVRFLEELRLFEGTITPFPMNTAAVSVAVKATNAPYGDVAYADPGYQDDGQKRYPLDTEAHCRAAWSYINQADNAAKYSSEELALIKGRIKAALRRYGVQVSESASLDFDALLDAARTAALLPDLAYKAAMAVLLDAYTPPEPSPAVESADEPEPTADAHADPEPVGPAAARDYASRFVTPGSRDDAPDGKQPNALAEVLIPLEIQRQNQEADRLEREITGALGRATR